jgi:ribosomal protein S18 acetylase RimI-like enzyme
MPLRRATSDDVPDLVRLRGVMYDAMDVDHSDPAWSSSCEAVLLAGLASGAMAAFVVSEGGAVVAGGVGMVEQRLPGPRNPSGRHGHVQSMATDVAFRGRGYGRAVFGALMEWFESVGVPSVDLHATASGEPLYRAYGFGEPRFTALVRHAR